MPLRRLLAPYRSLDRGIWYVSLARMVTTVGFSMVMPFMAIYFVEERGTGLTTFAMVQLIGGLFAAVGQQLAGELSDRIGRRRVMVRTLVLRFFVLLGMGFSVWWHASLVTLSLFLILNRLLWGTFEPVAQAAVTDLAGPEQRVAAFSLQRVGVNLGWAIGPAVGGALAGHSYGLMFFVVAPATLLAALAAGRVGGRAALPGEGSPGPTSILPSARELGALRRDHPAFVQFLGLGFLTGCVVVQIFSTFSTFLAEELAMPKAQIGLLYTVNAVVVLILQLPAVPAIERLGLGRAILVGSVFYATAFLGFGLTDRFAGLAVAVAIFTAGEVLLLPAMSDLAARLGDPKRMGRAFGLYGFSYSMGVSAGPILGGLAFDHVRRPHVLMWGLLAGAMLVTMAAQALFLRRHRLL